MCDGKLSDSDLLPEHLLASGLVYIPQCSSSGSSWTTFAVEEEPRLSTYSSPAYSLPTYVALFMHDCHPPMPTNAVSPGMFFVASRRSESESLSAVGPFGEELAMHKTKTELLFGRILNDFFCIFSKKTGELQCVAACSRLANLSAQLRPVARWTVEPQASKVVIF